MAAELLLPTARATDTNSDPYSGAQWFFYESGTLTPQAVFANATLATSLGPVVTADSAGKFVPVYFDASLTYRGICKNASGSVTLHDIDPINPGVLVEIAGSAGAGLVGFSHAATYDDGTVGEKLKRSVFVTDEPYGAVGDGIADDTAAIQAAIDAVEATGGTVIFPRGRYKVMSKLTVSSRHGVNLIGEMNGAYYSPAIDWPCIIVGAAMDYIIEYRAIDVGRSEFGGGHIDGLGFVDPTGTSGTPGTRSITAALHLRDFGGSLVENCYFHYLKGSAIRTNYSVMTTLRGLRIRYCGDGANGPIVLGATDASYTTQSFTIEDCRLEVCYATYLDMTNAFAFDITVSKCKFEAAPTEYPLSSHTFINAGVIRYLIDGCGFNRNDAIPLIMGGRGKCVNSTFANSTGARPSINMTGDRCLVATSQFEDLCTDFSVESSGVRNKLSECMFYQSGGFKSTGRGGQVVNCQFDQPSQTTGSYLIDLQGGADRATGNYLHDGGVAPSVGGIRSGGNDVVKHNQFDSWSALVGINGADADASISDNYFGSVVTPYSGTAAAGGVSVNGLKVLGPQQAAIPNLTTTATSGALPAPNGSVTIADAAAPTNAELLKYCVEIEAKLEASLAKDRVHGQIAT